MAAPISVIMPARNMRSFIGEAILSVCAQTLPVSELIIIDDGSTDDTASKAASVCRRLGSDLERGHRPIFLVFSQQHRGVSAARNLGIRVASEPWVAFLDADDVWNSQKIELQWSMITQYPQTGVASCEYQTFKDGARRNTSLPSCLTWPSSTEGRQLGRFLPRIGPDFFRSGFVPLPSTVIVRRRALDKAGGFDENMHAVEDYECFMRILAHHPLAIVERSLMGYRQHVNNTHRNLPLMKKYLLRYCELVAANPQNYPPGAIEASLRGLEWVRSCYVPD